MKSENLAIVFIDIAGFTARTSRQSREENQRMLGRFTGTVRQAIRGYNGKLIKEIGDAVLLTFRSPTDAVLCSMAIHDHLAVTEGSVAPAERFHIRAAINAGDVRVEGGDVFGEAVNIASRIEGVAPEGDVWFSEAVYLAMNRSEVPTEEKGHHELKGIPEPVRLYRVPRVDEDAGAMLRDRPGARTHLPFGGHGLERIPESSGIQAAVAVREVTDRLAPIAEKGKVGAGRAWGGFLSRYRSSATFRNATWVVSLVLVGAIGFGVYKITRPKKRRTPFEQIQNIFR